jgi:alpha-L-rhamnosidase
VVSDLQCEHLTDPLGIDVETPRFSWKIDDPANIRGQRQTAYRILVASHPDKLNRNKADIWDSGIIRYSQESQLIAYGGAKLQSGSDYYWKVIVYDRNRRASDWSHIARFSTGLFNRTDWKGQWIKHPTAQAKQHTWFRKHLTVTDHASSAFMYVASTGYHELYVNGHKVDERVLAPVLARIDKRVLYVTYDVSSFLKKGDNVIALWFAPGWSHYSSFTSAVDQALLVQLNGKTTQGDTFALHSDETWRCAESYSRHNGNFQLFDMGGEETNGRFYTTDWNRIAFDDSQWVMAKQVYPLKNGNEPVLSAQMTDPSRIIETVVPVSITDTIPGTWKADMGKIFTGFVEARFDGLNAGDTVSIQISDRPEKIDFFHQNHIYIARGENGETYRNRFNYFSGRYIHFTGLKQPPKLSEITGYAVTSAPKRTGYFESSNAMFNQMYNIDRWTYEMCTTEGYTGDCPNRERIGYGSEGGWQTTWGTGLPCFAAGAFYIKNVRDWSDALYPNGRMNHATPQSMDMAGSVLYGSANMNIAWEHYLAYGDKKILEEAYNAGKQWLDFLNEHISDGLLAPYAGKGYMFLGDWVGPGYRLEMGNTARAHFFNNCVYAMSLDYYIKIAEAINHNDETDIYRKRLQTLRRNIHERYFDPFLNSYLNGDQVRTTFALYAGVVPNDLIPVVLKHLEEDMTGEHPYFDIGAPSRYAYFKVLLANPHLHNIVAGIVSKTTSPGYGYFLSQGETTWPEVWEWDTHSSRVHTSFVGISSWFVKGLAGIEPDSYAPGYRSFTIRPNVVQNLTYAKAGIESPYGLIESGWRKEGNAIIYDITVPVGSEAHIYLPAKLSKIKEGGQSLTRVTGIKVTEEKDDSVLINAESGKYRFEVVSGN